MIHQIPAQNLVLNGDFENGLFGKCMFNNSNQVYTNIMSHSKAFGTNNQIDIMNFNCGFGNPHSGEWFIALASDSLSNDAISLELLNPLTQFNDYLLNFSLFGASNFGSKNDTIYIGLSFKDSVFGDTLLRILPLQDSWKRYSFQFRSSYSYTYITISKRKNSVGSWTWIDNLALSIPTGLSHLTLTQDNSLGTTPIGITSLKLRSLTIYNYQGKTVKQCNGECDLSHLSSGIYLWKSLSKGRLETGKINIQ